LEVIVAPKTKKPNKAGKRRNPQGWGGGNKTAEQENAERKAWLASLTDEEYEQLQRRGDLALRREPAPELRKRA
jgi:hypothetical protein